MLAVGLLWLGYRLNITYTKVMAKVVFMTMTMTERNVIKQKGKNLGFLYFYHLNCSKLSGYQDGHPTTMAAWCMSISGAVKLV